MEPDQFIRKICHDVRAPLRALQELPVWLEEDIKAHLHPIPTEIAELLKLQKTQAKRLDLIVTGMAELARLKKTQTRPITPVAQSAPNLGWPEWLRCEFGVDQIPLEPDHAKLAIAHLVSNAFKHADAQSSQADLRVSQIDDGIRIAVTDFGPGIDPQFTEKVYEPLYTLKPRDECEGSGMGLAVVAEIAKLYGGSRAIHANAAGPGITSEIVIPFH